MITIEQLEQYQQIKVELTKICKEWANQNLDSRWQHYCGFEIEQDYITINYSYYDIVNNIEYETYYISWSDMIEFVKTLGI
jgi:hypothetical protein